MNMDDPDEEATFELPELAKVIAKRMSTFYLSEQSARDEVVTQLSREVNNQNFERFGALFANI